MSRALQIEEQAAQWLLRREDEAWSADDEARFEAWLAEAAQHKVAYWRLEHGWRAADRASVLRQPSAPRARSAQRLVWRPWAVAAGLAVIIAGSAEIPVRRILDQRTYSTEVGERQAAPLKDGTRIELNTGSKLEAVVTHKARNVWLDHGEVYFEVAHDASRPFVIHAGPKTVTVLGTKFSVRRDGDHVEVAVVEGRVRVEDARPSPQGNTVLTAGDIAIAQGASTLIAQKSVEKVDAALGWRRGVLNFDQSTLADVAAEFNRYNRKKLVIEDPKAAEIRIGGSFDADKVDDFISLLQRGFGLKIEADGQTVKISS